jgi:hypothetical protein
VLNQGYQGASGSISNQDQGWGCQGSLISGSQALLGTQGTSGYQGYQESGQDQGWPGGNQVLSLISLIQHRFKL